MSAKDDKEISVSDEWKPLGGVVLSPDNDNENEEEVAIPILCRGEATSSSLAEQGHDVPPITGLARVTSSVSVPSPPSSPSKAASNDRVMSPRSASSRLRSPRNLFSRSNTSSAQSHPPQQVDQHQVPASSVHPAISNAVLSGYLQKKKKSRALGGFQRRFFALHDGVLHYFEDAHGTKPLKSFALLTTSLKASKDSSRQLELWPGAGGSGEVYVLQAESDSDLLKWMQAVDEACEQAMLSSFAQYKSPRGGKGGLDSVSVMKSAKPGAEDQAEEVPEWRLMLNSALQLPANRICAECNASIASDPWASINLGVFICIECSGVHRSLGTSVSKVRSVLLDEWTIEQAQTMHRIGNTCANDHWCALYKGESDNALAQPTKSASREQKERWIKAKYVEQRWVPSAAAHQPERSTASAEGSPRSGSVGLSAAAIHAYKANAIRRYAEQQQQAVAALSPRAGAGAPSDVSPRGDRSGSSGPTPLSPRRSPRSVLKLSPRQFSSRSKSNAPKRSSSTGKLRSSGPLRMSDSLATDRRQQQEDTSDEHPSVAPVPIDAPLPLDSLLSQLTHNEPLVDQLRVLLCGDVLASIEQFKETTQATIDQLQKDLDALGNPNQIN